MRRAAAGAYVCARGHMACPSVVGWCVWPGVASSAVTDPFRSNSNRLFENAQAGVEILSACCSERGRALAPARVPGQNRTDPLNGCAGEGGHVGQRQHERPSGRAREATN